MHIPYNLVDELEPDFGMKPKTALETARGDAQPAEPRRMWTYNLSEMARELEDEPTFGPDPLGRLLKSQVAEQRPCLPIHRAMARMLHADERYANRTFMPGGLLVE
jgi:hypothetical protein